MAGNGKSTIMDALKEMMDKGLNKKDASRLCRALIAAMIVFLIGSIIVFIRNLTI